MRRAILPIILGVGLGVGTSLGAQSFEYGFTLESDAVADLDSSNRIEDAPGTEVEFQANCTLTSSELEGDAGPQGWSLGVRNEGLEILDATVQGTVAADVGDDPPGLRDGGFEVTGLIDPDREVDGSPQGQGFVSAIVLSFTQPITLPPNQTDVVAIATYRATVGDAESQGTLEYVNGLVGEGQPVMNNVTLEGTSFEPTFQNRTIDIAPEVAEEICDNGTDDDGDDLVDCEDPDCEGDPACVEDCDDGADNDGDDLVDCEDPDCEGDPACATGGFALLIDADGASEGVLEVPTPVAGKGFETEISIAPASAEKPPENGAQGWSLGVAHDDALLQANSATTMGTLAADVGDEPPGLRDGGFEDTQVVDPANNDGQGGIVSAVVLSFTQPITLDPTAVSPILRVDYSVRDEVADGDLDTTLEFVDGLVGTGQPVDTVLTVEGKTVPPAVTGTLQVTAGQAPVEEAFVRGDANDDGRVNIADPIWIINELFREGPATACQDAADATDDGLVDLADAMFIIEYRFLAGSLPSAPFPDCGTDPTEDELVCEPDSFTSCP